MIRTMRQHNENFESAADELGLTLGVLLEERRMLEGLMSLWMMHLSVPKCRYSIARAISIATLYLASQDSTFLLLFLIFPALPSNSAE